MRATDVWKTRLLALFVVLLMMPLAILGTSDYEPEDNEVEIDLPSEANHWPTEARSGATSWLFENADTEGDTGLFMSSAIASDGTIWVAYYSAYGRDLKVAKWNGWSWETDTVYAFGDIGKYAEIDLDSNENPRIASFDVTNAILRISRYDGSAWSTQTVAPGENTGQGDPYSGSGRIGFSIDDTDSEWYSFFVEEVETSSSFDYNLSFAFWDSSDSTWAYGTIDDGQGERADVSEWSETGKFSSLKIGADGKPRVAYISEIWQGVDLIPQGVDYYPHYALRYAAFDGGSWAITDVEVNSTGSAYRPAWWLEMVVDGSGNEYIAYQNNTGFDTVRLATLTGSTWTTELLANGTKNLGTTIRAEASSGGELHISYYDSSNYDLVMLRGSNSNYEEVTVASLGTVGEYADLVIDANGEEVFAYRDGDDKDLVMATPAADSDGDGVADAQDRCQNTPAGKVIDDSGCHYDKQILTVDGSDNQYVDVVEGADGLLRLAHYRSLPEGVDSCDRNIGNETEDCNLVYRVQQADGSWGAPVAVDRRGETGRYASIAISPDGTESIAYHAKTATNNFGFVTQTAAMIATNDGTGWTTSTISESNSTGWYTDLAIDSNGNRAVTYTDNSGDFSELIFAREVGNSWQEETVQMNGTFASVAFVNDVAHVAYYSSNPEMIRLAIEDGSGGWSITNITTTGVVSAYRLDIDVTDDGRLLIGYMRGLDDASDTICDSPQECTIQVAEWDGANLTYHILHTSTSYSYAYVSIDEDSAGNLHAAWYDSRTDALQIASPTRFGHETLTLLDDAAGGTYPKLVVDENGWEQVWYHAGSQLREVHRWAWEEDHDFIDNDDDQCPGTPYGAEDIDFYGCAYEQRDDDYDAISNADDQCPNTPSFERHLADSEGCSPSQKDTDGDGVMDNADLCSGTTDLETVDNNGCSDEQRDTDGDSVPDNQDQCEDTPLGESADLNGCSESQRDNDDDGVKDKDDFMPNDASQQTDRDGDGFGDNPEGTQGDDCPDEPGTSQGEPAGCPDYDGDGLADSVDDDDDGDGWSDADEIANGTDPLYPLDFPMTDDSSDGGDGGDGGDDGSDGDTSGNAGGDEGQGDSGPSVVLMIGIVALVVALLGVVVVLLLPKKGGSAAAMPPIPSLTQAKAELTTAAEPAATSSGGKGEMVKLDKPCKHCGAMEVHHIPSYGADYCKSCSQYN